MSWTVAIGVDTHKDAHVAVACDRLGRQLDALEFAPTPVGCVQLWSWAEALGEPAFALEGSGSYGAGLARFLTAAGACVYECERPHRRARRRGKSDLIDAALAARRPCAGEGLAQLRGGGKREELRLLLLERRSAQRARTCALNQLRAVVVAAPADLRSRLERLNGERLAERASRLRGGPTRATLIAVLRRLGRRARALAAEVPSSTSSCARSCTLSGLSSCGSRASARCAPRSCSSRAGRLAACAARPPSPRSPARARSTPRVAAGSVTGSTAAGIDS
jgi:transposase